MLRLFSVLLMICLHGSVQGQTDQGVDAGRLEHVLEVLASDSLKGRGNYTVELKKAAAFITDQFKAAGLQPLFTDSGYLQFFRETSFAQTKAQALTAQNYDPKAWLANVIGVLPGHDKPEEIVIFSAHYDHIGSRKRGRDPIYNGANDNASGTAAMVALAHYFARQKANSRTLWFCAFSGEELGLWGSKYFAQTIDAKKVVAVINLEMLGRSGAVGVNNFFLTGDQHSNLAAIFTRNLQGSAVQLKPEQNSLYGDLFLRSDNYPFAQLGIAAHTVMSSNDSEACYHRPCDEVNIIDKAHLLAVTNGIIMATKTLVNDTERPVVHSVPE